MSAALMAASLIPALNLAAAMPTVIVMITIPVMELRFVKPEPASVKQAAP
jgi:hypothetical protein